MFTGIIEYQGSVRSIEPKNQSIYYWVDCPDILTEIKIGSSIAHDGICLTVLEIDESGYLFQLIPETVAKTNFSQKKVGDKVNLETSLSLQKKLDGHLVMGHIDGVGKVVNYLQEQDNWVLRIAPPVQFLKYITYKGSICLNGVSLTVSAQNDETFEVSLIQHTLENTNLGSLKVDDFVNFEIDTVARYLEKLLKN